MPAGGSVDGMSLFSLDALGSVSGSAQRAAPPACSARTAPPEISGWCPQWSLASGRGLRLLP
jgi:hypothetical protein